MSNRGTGRPEKKHRHLYNNYDYDKKLDKNIWLCIYCGKSKPTASKGEGK